MEVTHKLASKPPSSVEPLVGGGDVITQGPQRWAEFIEITETCCFQDLESNVCQDMQPLLSVITKVPCGGGAARRCRYFKLENLVKTQKTA